jgi:hypothetical protein
LYSTEAERFSIAVLSTAMEKSFVSVLSASRAKPRMGRDKRAVKNILSLTRIAKLGPSRPAGSFKGLIKGGRINERARD